MRANYSPASGRCRAWPGTRCRPSILVGGGPLPHRGGSRADGGAPGSRSKVLYVPAGASPGGTRGPEPRRPVRSKVRYVVSVRSWGYVAVPPCFAPLRRIPRARATPSNNKAISPWWLPTILVSSLICAQSCKHWRSAALSARSCHRKPPLPRPDEAAERRTRNIGLCRRERDTGVCSIPPRPNSYDTFLSLPPSTRGFRAIADVSPEVMPTLGNRA